MANKIQKKYLYEGLGFPIELHDVEMIEFEGELHPKIDVRKVADAVIKALVFWERRLTGNQIKFIRTYFAMSLRTFAKEVVNESHAAVKKWEDCGDKVTNMDLNIEKALRLYMLDKVVIPEKKTSKFREGYHRVDKTLSKEISTKASCVSVNVV